MFMSISFSPGLVHLNPKGKAQYYGLPWHLMNPETNGIATSSPPSSAPVDKIYPNNSPYWGDQAVPAYPRVAHLGPSISQNYSNYSNHIPLQELGGTTPSWYYNYKACLPPPCEAQHGLRCPPLPGCEYLWLITFSLICPVFSVMCLALLVTLG